MAGWKAHSRLPISDNEPFRQLSRLRRYERILVQIVVLEREWVTWSANLKGNRGSPTNDCWRHKTRVPGLSHGVVVADHLCYVKRR